ncbi:hypothetical protein HG530_007421 [Fusarium avenaceum]|nr:hypothetical protein HG530_007421 [Fusarium avenaceum]
MPCIIGRNITFWLVRVAFDVVARVVSVYHFGIGLLICVDDKKLFFSSSQKTINLDLTIQNANHSTGAGIQNIIFVTATIAEDDNDLFPGILTDKGFKTGDPIRQGIHVRLDPDSRT